MGIFKTKQFKSSVVIAGIDIDNLSETYLQSTATKTLFCLHHQEELRQPILHNVDNHKIITVNLLSADCLNKAFS